MASTESDKIDGDTKPGTNIMVSPSLCCCEFRVGEH